MAIRNKKQIKAEILSMLKDCKGKDLKEIIAELSEQFLELAVSVDQTQDLVRTLSAALYFYSIQNLSLQDILIDSGIITRDNLRAKISECPEKKKLAEYLGLNFLNYPGIDISDKERLEKWLDPGALDKINKLN